MKNRTRFTILAAASCAAALALAFPTAQATPLTSAEQFTNPSFAATNLIDTKAAAGPTIMSVINSIYAPAYTKMPAAGYTMIGTAIDTAPLGYLDAKYTFNNGASMNPAATLGANSNNRDNLISKSYNTDVISANPGDSRDTPTPPTKISIVTGGVDINAGTYILGVNDINTGYGAGVHPVAGGENELNATVYYLFSHLARVAVGVEAANTYIVISNSSQAGGAVSL